MYIISGGSTPFHFALLYLFVLGDHFSQDGGQLLSIPVLLLSDQPSQPGSAV